MFGHKGRDVSEKVAEHFYNDKKLSASNTQIKIEDGFVKLYLFKNLIAKKPVGGNEDTVMVTNAGWPSNTTRDRLNALGGRFSLRGGTRGVQLSATMYLNGEPMENGKWYSLTGKVKVDASSEISKEIAYEKAPRGYGYVERPVFAVAGANDTGGWPDSPAPTHINEKEISGFVKVLSANGIKSEVMALASDNVFLQRVFVIVSEKDHPKALELAKEYLKTGTNGNGTRLFYTEEILKNKLEEV